MSEELRISKPQAKAIKAFRRKIDAEISAYRTLGMPSHAEGMERCASIAAEMLVQARSPYKPLSEDVKAQRRAVIARATAARMAKRKAAQS